jgi:hypothetical protein
LARLPADVEKFGGKQNRHPEFVWKKETFCPQLFDEPGNTA